MVIALSARGTSSEGVRPVSIVQDIPQIVRLLRSTFGDSLDSDERGAFSQLGTRSDFMWRFDPSTARLSQGFVWEADGRIVGNVTVIPTKVWDRFLVANVAVDPSYRRRGIAHALMQAVTRDISLRGGRKILLQVVKSNEKAIHLYEGIGYSQVGNMEHWMVSPSRLRLIQPSIAGELLPEIRHLPSRQWQKAYDLDRLHVPSDLDFPEPLAPDAYRPTIVKRMGDFFSGRQRESWSIVDKDQQSLRGIASILSEWGRPHVISIRVHPQWVGRIERPLLAKVLRRLTYLSRRATRIEHPEQDKDVSALLREANFDRRRIMTHMKLNITN